MEHLKDEQGSAIVGWVCSNVLFARLERTITEELGVRFARRLAAKIGAAVDVQFFLDLSAISSFDVKAFAAVADAMLAKRPRFDRIAIHIWQLPLSAKAKALREAFGRFDYITSSGEFEDRLTMVAPLALDAIDEFRRFIVAVERAVAPAPARLVTTERPRSPEHTTYAYVFDLSNFEQGAFTAFRSSQLTVRPGGTWLCLARDDDEALQLAQRAALVEWARPSSRPADEFTVKFLRTPAGVDVTALR